MGELFGGPSLHSPASLHSFCWPWVGRQCCTTQRCWHRAGLGGNVHYTAAGTTGPWVGTHYTALLALQWVDVLPTARWHCRPGLGGNAAYTALLALQALGWAACCTAALLA
jgi:hypothetical protein